MITRIGNAIYRRFVLNRYIKEQLSSESNREESLVMAKINPTVMTPLNDKEKSQVQKLWSPLLGGGNLLSFRELSMFKHFHGFDPRFVSHYIYLPILSHRLNNYKYTMMFEHKSLLGTLSKSKLRFPHCIIRCVDGEFYDNEMMQLSEDEAIQKCQCATPIIIKDSVEASGGMSVKKLILSDKSDSERKKIVTECVQERKRHDFVIQECIQQHPSMAQFNKTSVNTVRVTTLYLNGWFTVLSICLRIGQSGMKVDNWGAGGIIIGVNPDGKLSEKGYDNRYNVYNGSNGVNFGEASLPQIPSLLKELEEAHTRHFSLCKLIGWDITFDQNNLPVVIELNSSQPGLIGEQLVHGPIFGDRTEEVIAYCAGKRDFYNRAPFIY